jgi:hypothetical protein
MCTDLEVTDVKLLKCQLVSLCILQPSPCLCGKTLSLSLTPPPPHTHTPSPPPPLSGLSKSPLSL